MGDDSMTATITALTFYGCPDWCQRTDHHADLVGPGNSPMHYDPGFGRVDVRAVGDHTPFAHVVGADNLTADDLRKLAADDLAAAEWLEQYSRARS